MTRATVAAAVDGAHRAHQALADPLTGRTPTGIPWADEPLFKDTCANLGYPQWEAGEPFPHRTVVGEVATAPIPLRAIREAVAS